MMEENEGNVISDVNEKNTKNNKGLIIGIVIAVAVVLIIAGCFTFSKGILGSKKIVGYYELCEMTSGEENYSHEDLESLKSLGLNVTLELNEDKTGTLNLFGEEMNLTYDNKNMTVDGEAAPYKVEDGKISMEQDGEKLVFEKTEKPENSEPSEEK